MTTTRPRSDARRGMLLLVVLLLLAMFLGIGAVLLTIATRARTAARANTAAINDGALGDSLAREALDQALMALIRGAAGNRSGSVTMAGADESLLADKYGPPITGTCTRLTNTTTPVVWLNLAGLRTMTGSALPASPGPGPQYNGCVLTLRPRPRSGVAATGDMLSYRILGMTVGASPLCYVSHLPGRRGPPLMFSGTPTLSGTFDIVINGREFTPTTESPFPDAYDAPDSQNAFLARPVLTGGTFAGYEKFSFAEPGSIPTVDNDNDGMNDGVWISGTVIPSIPSPLGGTIRFDVSYLVVDLDGRLNLNTAGVVGTGTTAAEYDANTPGAIPPGMGYGPADAQLSLAFPPSTPPGTLPAALSPNALALLTGGTLPAPSTTPTPSQRRTPPRLGRIDGRYGWLASGTAAPGQAGDDTTAIQQTTATAYANTTLPLAGNSTADLQSRMKASTSGSPPTLTFSLPTGGFGSANDWVDDPYELRLDADAGSFGMVRRPATTAAQEDSDSPYTLAELERLLRPNDIDAPQLPARLAAVAGDAGQTTRALYTTDSWDTPALTGTAASLVQRNVLSGSAVQRPAYAWASSNAVAADVAAGLRFNLNRPVGPGTSNNTQQQLYCKGLYTLIVALNPTLDRARAAQWAVNVLDYRDNDSRMTRFLYAPSLSSGWPAAPTNVVWGVERPDLVITAVTTESNLVKSVTLLHPWRAIVRQGTTVTGTTEMVDASLAAAGIQNSVDLKKTVGTSDSIWRLRCGAATAPGSGLTGITTFAAHASGAVTPSNLTFTPGAQVILERLADPSQPFNATSNDYRPVDVFDPAQPRPQPPSIPWIPWPNRPFISHGELLLIPSGTTALTVAGSLAATDNTKDLDVRSLAAPATGDIPPEKCVPQILDAAYVPSRFAGHAVGVSGASINQVGLNELPANHFSKWREPGRVNVNTIPSNPDGSSPIWAALVGGATPPNPFRAAPATSVADMLTRLPAYGDVRDQNPHGGRGMAVRLANSTTVRSQVFAIWITVRIRDDSPNAPSPVTKRMFVIYDRSIPVGYFPGLDLNVRDGIKLERFLD